LANAIENISTDKKKGEKLNTEILKLTVARDVMATEINEKTLTIITL
jgi:hypothetical protein